MACCKVLSQHLKGLVKKKIMSLVGDEAEIQSRHTPDTSQKSYGFSQLAQHFSC